MRSSCDGALTASLHHSMCLVHVLIPCPSYFPVDLASFAGSPTLCQRSIALNVQQDKNPNGVHEPDPGGEGLTGLRDSVCSIELLALLMR